MKHSLSEGSLTLEAAFTLSFFLLAMLSWILVFVSFQVQSMTQHALDQSCLALADKISLAHTLTGKESGLSRFVEVAAKKKISISLPEIMREVGGNLAIDISGQREFRHYFGSGKGFLKTMKQVDYSLHLDDDRDLLQADLSYLLELPGILKPLGPLSIHQASTAGLWLLTDKPVFGGDEQDDKEEESVWNKPPFMRGKILVERFRQRAEAIQLQKGQIADLFYADGTVEAIVSLNLFSSTYAVGSGKKAEQYTLKEEAILHVLTAQAKKVKRAVEKQENWTKSDGTSFSRAPRSVRLHVILPEEASYFSASLVALTKRIQQEEGVSISYTYEEKALFTM